MSGSVTASPTPGTLCFSPLTIQPICVPYSPRHVPVEWFWLPLTDWQSNPHKWLWCSSGSSRLWPCQITAGCQHEHIQVLWCLAHLSQPAGIWRWGPPSSFLRCSPWLTLCGYSSAIQKLKLLKSSAVKRQFGAGPGPGGGNNAQTPDTLEDMDWATSVHFGWTQSKLFIWWLLDSQVSMQSTFNPKRPGKTSHSPSGDLSVLILDMENIAFPFDF